MSGNLAYALPARSPRTEQHPRRIELVSPQSHRRARPRLGYALVAVGGIFVILLAQLLLSIALSNGAYSIAHLTGQQRDLGRVQQSLTEQLNLSGSTQNLVSSAHALGMVGANSPVFLRLADGKVLGGAASAAVGGALPGTSSVPNALLAGNESSDISFTRHASGDALANPSSSLAPAASPSSPTRPAADTTGPVASNPGALPSPVTH